MKVRHAALLPLALLAGCSADASTAPEEALGTARAALTIEQEIAKATCATSSAVVAGLSDQILDELATCLKPGVLVKAPTDAKISNASVHPYLVKPAYEALKKAAATRSDTIEVSSMFRTVAQQYFLWRRSSCYPAVAAPGTSNHETGIAMDVSDPDNSTWKSALEAQGFKWLGSFDRFHFDYLGPGSVNLRGQDVLAFQRLWNRNNPADKIDEDGSWGPQTEARLKKSPAGGFPIGADCGPPPATTKPWPNLQIDAAAEGKDRFTDGASAAIVDVMEGDAYAVNVLVKNAGDAAAKDVSLGLWIEQPYVQATRWDVESDLGRPGTFAPSAANDLAGNPPHDQPGQAFTLKIDALAPGETKRVRLAMKAAQYSIGPTNGPDVRAWVREVPGVYAKADFGSKPDNVDGRQTDSGGDLKVRAPVDVYSRVRWSFDGGVLEGWSAYGADASAEAPGKGLAITTSDVARDATWSLTSPETSFAAAEWGALQLRLAAGTGGPATLEFATSDAPTFDERRRIALTLPNAPGEVVARLQDHPSWRGTITRLRLSRTGGGLALDDARMTTSAPAAPAAKDAEPTGCGCQLIGRPAAGRTCGLTLLALVALVRRRRR